MFRRSLSHSCLAFSVCGRGASHTEEITVDQARLTIGIGGTRLSDKSACSSSSPPPPHVSQARFCYTPMLEIWVLHNVAAQGKKDHDAKRTKITCPCSSKDRLLNTQKYVCIIIHIYVSVTYIYIHMYVCMYNGICV